MLSRLPLVWQKRGLMACLFWPLSLLYRGLWALRRWGYHRGYWPSHRLPVPVLVVGNVVVGGAGKTPTVQAILRHLQQRGWTPGVVSRGHGRRTDPTQAWIEVRPDSPADEVGDEPLLLRQSSGVPVVVGRERAEAGKHLLQQHPEVDFVVCDDGMQHWGLARDITVVVFDERGTGNGWLLPAGLLREPWPARPWGDGAWLVLRTQRPDGKPSPLPPPPEHKTVHTAWRHLAQEVENAAGQRQTWAALANQAPLAALAGIAQPERFFEMLRGQGMVLQQTHALTDHASTSALVATLALGPTQHWFCTEKDAVKLFPALSTQPALAARVWRVALEQTPPPAFWAELDRALQSLPKPLSSAHGCQTA